jgi:hypothetical protein
LTSHPTSPRFRQSATIGKVTPPSADQTEMGYAKHSTVAACEKGLIRVAVGRNDLKAVVRT